MLVVLTEEELMMIGWSFKKKLKSKINVSHYLYKLNKVTKINKSRSIELSNWSNNNTKLTSLGFAKYSWWFSKRRALSLKSPTQTWFSSLGQNSPISRNSFSFQIMRITILTFLNRAFGLKFNFYQKKNSKCFMGVCVFGWARGCTDWKIS